MQRDHSNKSRSTTSYDSQSGVADLDGHHNTHGATSTMTFFEFRRKLRTCFRRNGLAILCCLFGLFWCSLAVVMILLYANLVKDIPYTPPEETLQWKKPDVQREKPGVQKETPGVQKERPGIQREKPGVQKERPGIQREKPGVQKEKPGIQKEKPDVQREKPGVQTERPDVLREKQGVQWEKQGIQREILDVQRERRAPCDGIFCEFHGVCTVGIDNLPSCNCIDVCRTDVSKVCGTNGITFNNECELKRHSCHEKTRVNIKYQGPCLVDPCKEYKNCSYPSVCQLDRNRNPTCKCHEACPDTLDLVCGSDGKKYGNPCLLRREACLTNNPSLKVISRGNCAESNPCRGITCPYGDCMIDRNNNPVCKCLDKCAPVVKPVCGSNGMNFDNECKLRQYACTNKIKDLHVLKEGNCDIGPCSLVRCPIEGQICVEDKNGATRCQCKSCPNDFKPICGSNNRTYDSECAIQKENCEKGTNVQIKHTGYCAGEGCGTVKKCEYFSFCNGTGPYAKCVCPTNMSCEYTEAPVCGNDSKEYHNECFLRVASCEQKKTIYIKSHGQCDLCNGQVCNYGSHCVNGQCICPRYCESGGKPVCASDGTKYMNRCKMRKAACQQKTTLYEDVCKDVDEPDVGPIEGSGDGSGEGSGDEDGSGDGESVESLILCDSSICPYGGYCQIRNGEVECICDLDCDALRAPVCGSDGKTYGNLCEMKEEACRTKRKIQEIPMENCNDIAEEPCDGDAPLVDPITGLDYNCAVWHGVCPQRSYCHLQYGKCCAEERLPIDTGSCIKSEYGWCGDGITFALGPSRAGCPETCRCNKYGSISLQCNPRKGYCDCKDGVGGEKCDRCLPKFWGLADLSFDGCRPCNCNEYGSRREDCRQNDGKCECKDNIRGQQCDMCPDGTLVYFDVCGFDNEMTRYDGTDCSEITCRFGGYCAQEGSGVVCKCDGLECLQSNLGINGLEQCGNDSKTYRSNCHMQYQACKEQRPIVRAYIGPCIDAVTPRMDQPINRPRKTTRHIVSKVTNMMTIKSTARPPTKSRFTGKISDICYDDSYCIAENSQCYLGTCQCLDGYIPSLDGEKCLEVKTAMPLETVENLTPCYNNPCRNGGTCELDESLGYRCLCPLGYTGPVCAEDVYITSPAFSGKSTLVMKEVRQPSDDLMFQIAFLSYNRDGIILYASQYPNGTGDFVSVALNNGILEYRYDLGSGVAVIRSEHELATQVEHKVIVNRLGKKGFLKVDGDPIINAESPGSLTSLDLSGNIFLGNLPDSASRKIADRIGVTIGLAGCITMFQTGESNAPVYYNLAYPQFSGDIIGGRDMRQCGTNPCHSMPCKHGGNCLMADSEMYQCICRKGFSGELCQKVLDPCLTYHCREGSTCQLSENGYPECVCPENMEGEFCEYERLKKIFVPQFIGSSYIEIPVGEVGSNSLSIRVWFMTSKPNGVIMYASQFPNGIGDYISLNIVNQKIEFKFNMGTSTVTIRSGKIVQLGKWHEVLIQIIGRNGTLLVDNKDKWRYTGKSEGVLTELNLAGSSLFLGGFVNNYSIPYDSGIQYNLTGVIQRIYINGHQYDDLMETAKDALGILEYKGPPCNVNPCLNGGICVPRLEEADCKCPTKYYGQRCEKKADSINRDLPVDFDGSTYLQYPNEVTTKQRAQRVNRYTIKFRTRSNGGLMIFQNGRSNILGDYLAIAIVNGRVEFSYNLGKQTDQTLHILKSVVRVDDGKWHLIMASRDERAGILQVDNESLISAESYVGATQLDTNGMLWIGGKTELPLGLPSEYYTGFTGCIKEVLIDNRKLHLFDHRNGQSTSVIKFCHL